VITDYQGNKVSAKKYARQQVLAAIGVASSYVYDDRSGTLTQAEKDEILRLIQKDADRCARLLGFDGSDQA
jgi:hypothetical protein